jgi:hypothetical protein
LNNACQVELSEELCASEEMEIRKRVGKVGDGKKPGRIGVREEV